MTNEPIENKTVVINIPKANNKVIELKPLPKTNVNNEIEDSTQPFIEKLKDNSSAIAACVAFGANICTGVPFLLEQLNMIQNITNTMNFIIFPIAMLISTIVYFVMPVSISWLRKKVIELEKKEDANAYEIREIEHMMTSLSTTHDTVTQRAGIKPFSSSNITKQYLDNLNSNNNIPVGDDLESNNEDIRFIDPKSGAVFCVPDGYKLTKN